MYFLIHELFSKFNKILSAVHMDEEFEGVVEKLRKVILPCYVKGTKLESGPSHIHRSDEDQISMLLKDEMPKVLLGGNKDDVSYCFYCYPINANTCGFFRTRC